MEKKSPFRKIIFAMAILLIAGALLLGPALLARGENNTTAETTNALVYSVRTADTQRQTLRVFLDVNGDIVSVQHLP